MMKRRDGGAISFSLSCAHNCFAMYALFPEYGARTGPQDL